MQPGRLGLKIDLPIGRICNQVDLDSHMQPGRLGLKIDLPSRICNQVDLDLR